MNTWFESLARSETKDELVGCINSHIAEAGFDYWAYNVVISRSDEECRRFFLHNCPPDLWEAYQGCCKSKRDPITSRSNEFITPKPWAITAASLNAIDLDPKRRGLFEAAHREGVKGGICTPIRDRGELLGSVTLASRSASIDWLNAQQPFAMLFSVHLHQACLRFVEEMRDDAKPRLSPRELECLSWAAKGKTSWEIGMLLQISERTVTYHLQNAGGKLGTQSRQQAIAQSIMLGVL